LSGKDFLKKMASAAFTKFADQLSTTPAVSLNQGTHSICRYPEKPQNRRTTFCGVIKT
jgi:hypothetical protein